MPSAAVAHGAPWAQQGAQTAVLLCLPISRGTHSLTPWEMSRVTLPVIKLLGCCPGSHAHLPLPRARAPGGVEPWVGACRQGRDAGGIASPTDASMGGQVSAEPISEAAPPYQQSWNEVPGSPGWEANPELNVALPGVPLDTETPVLSPHILPAVPSVAQLVQLHSPLVLCPMPGWVMLQLRRGQCRSHSRQSAGMLC